MRPPCIPDSVMKKREIGDFSTIKTVRKLVSVIVYPRIIKLSIIIYYINNYLNIYYYYIIFCIIYIYIYMSLCICYII